MKGPTISLVIPTYRRERILIDSIELLQGLSPAPGEIVVVDQTDNHDEATANALLMFEERDKIRLICLSEPSIPHAMNVGLQEAKGDIVLFLDDDIIPDKNLISAHLRAHEEGHNIVAGQVLQPGEGPVAISNLDPFLFRSDCRQYISEFMGGNFSVKKETACALGGFDENFVHVAYRFEKEFADRASGAGERILYEPSASIRHLKTERGGTRSYGSHLTTIRPSHCVGEYYYFLVSKRVRQRFRQMLLRPLRAVYTKHHLRKPWWIPVTFVAELTGMIWAIFLRLRGPRYIRIKE